MHDSSTGVADAADASFLCEAKVSAQSVTADSPSMTSNQCPPPPSYDTQGESIPPKEVIEEDGQVKAGTAKPSSPRPVDASLSESSPRLVFVWNPYGVRFTQDDGVALSPHHYPTASSSSAEAPRLGGAPATEADEGRAYRSTSIDPAPALAQARSHQTGHATPSQRPTRGGAGQPAMSLAALAASGSSASAQREADGGANRLISPPSGLRRVEFYTDDCRQYYLDYSPTASSASCGVSMTLMPALVLPPRKDCVDGARIRARMTRSVPRATASAPSVEAGRTTPQAQPQQRDGGPASIGPDTLTTNATSTPTTEERIVSAPTSAMLRGVSTWPQAAPSFDPTGCDSGLRNLASAQHMPTNQAWLAVPALSPSLLKLEEDTTAAMLEQITTQPSYFLQRFLPPPPSVPTMRQTMSPEAVRAACYRWFEHVRALTASGMVAMPSERQSEETEGKTVTSLLPCPGAGDDTELGQWYDQAVTWWSIMSGIDEEYIRVPARSVMAALNTVSAAAAAGVPVTMYESNSNSGADGGAATQGAARLRGGSRRIVSSDYGSYDEYKSARAARFVRSSAERYYSGNASTYHRSYGLNQPYPTGPSSAGLQRYGYSPLGEVPVGDQLDTLYGPPT